ncbi:MAG: gluconate 2-dehydrogenase subunit 3 family protein [Saprospiraceae bacterium]
MTRRQALQRAAFISGVALTPALLTILEGCQNAPVLDWQPQAMNQEQAVLVGKIANRILPPTETLGALDVGVDQFIDTMVQHFFSEVERMQFLQQLDAFSLQNKSFVSDTDEVQDEKIALVEQNYIKAQATDSNTPKSFWRTIKELTLFGYFTSEAVLKEQLNYHPVPGRYDADVALADDPRLYEDNNV